MSDSEANEAVIDDGMLRDVLAGNFRAVARLITLIENQSSESIEYLRELFPHSGRCLTVGVTGSPGTGKSTLVDRLGSKYRKDGKKLGIIAVDPTSPFTGGAILGDRIRMQSRNNAGGTFIRSMATRGHLGGLARATSDTLLVLDSAGFDVVLVETVGVGQDEVEIVRLAEVTLVILVPGMGDDIQAMKAGIMEIGDVFVINKTDHAGVNRIEMELNGLLSISNRQDGWKPLIVKTIASEDEGIDECLQCIDSYRDFLTTSPVRRERVVHGQRERLLEIVRSKVTKDIIENGVVAKKLTELANQVADRKIDPYAAVEILLRDVGFTSC